MPRQVEVEITSEGKLHLEFIGFPGEECFDEAGKIQKLLAGLGVHVNVDDIERKPGGQIEAEIGLDEKKEEKIPTQEGKS